MSTTTIRKLRYYSFKQQQKQVQICYYNRPILYQRWYNSCFNHGTRIYPFCRHFDASYRQQQQPKCSNYYHTLQQQSNTIWNRSLLISINHINSKINTSSSSSSSLQILLRTTIRTKWSISLSDNNDETKSTVIHDANDNDNDNNNNCDDDDDDDENQTNNKNIKSHTDDVDTSSHMDTTPTNTTIDSSSTASTNNRTKKEKKGTILDISTYHGWDCMDAQDTSSNIDGMTIMKKEIAEWDPIRKKIVKKVITSIVKQPATTKKTSKYGITTTTTEDNIAAQFTYDGKNLRTKELNAIRRAKIKAARKNPTSKHCKMCPICHKHFAGHNSMVSHLLYREKCVSVLDPTIKDILIKQKKHQQKKSIRRKLRRKHLPIYSDSSDSDTDDDSDIDDDDDDEKGKNNAKQKSKKKGNKKDENKGDQTDVTVNEVNDVEVNIKEDNNHNKSDNVVIQQTST